MNRLVVAGNGGVGLAMVKYLLKEYPEDGVFATYRRNLPELSDPNLRWIQMDAASDDSVKNALGRIESLDWVINAAGFLH